MVMRQHKGCFNPYSTSQTHFNSFVTCHLPGFGMLYKNVTLGRLGRRVLLDLQRTENVYDTCNIPCHCQVRTCVI